MSVRPAALLLALVAAVTTAGARADAASGSVLWSVRGPQNVVYLFGSIHALRPDDARLPDAAVAAYGEAEQLVMEIDLDDPTLTDPAVMATQMRLAAQLPDGQSLRSVLGEDYPGIAARAARDGLDLPALDRFAPWFVATLMLQVEIARQGFTTEHGVEQQFVDRALADRKPILGLETPAEQFAVLASLSLPDQKRFLLKTLEDSAGAQARLEQLLQAWRTGDTATLASELSEEFEAFPELYRPLTEDRNRAWVERLVALLAGPDDYLVVVGALHLVGRNSVVDLLRQRGYAVTRH